MTVHSLPIESTKVILQDPCPRTRIDIPETIPKSEGLRVMKSSRTAKKWELAPLSTTHRLECIAIDEKKLYNLYDVGPIDRSREIVSTGIR